MKKKRCWSTAERKYVHYYPQIFTWTSCNHSHETTDSIWTGLRFLTSQGFHPVISSLIQLGFNFPRRDIYNWEAMRKGSFRGLWGFTMRTVDHKLWPLQGTCHVWSHAFQAKWLRSAGVYSARKTKLLKSISISLYSPPLSLSSLLAHHHLSSMWILLLSVIIISVCVLSHHLSSSNFGWSQLIHIYKQLSMTATWQNQLPCNQRGIGICSKGEWT